MRILVTGNEGYVGSCLVPLLQRRGHEVLGLDGGIFTGCGTGEAVPPADVQIRADIRDASPAHLEGLDAVIHLAGISNDPLGELDADLTTEINAHASARLAALAHDAGVARFVLASSCSVYGAAGDDWLDEASPCGPVTAYARSKLMAEQAVMGLSDDSFVPTVLRPATAFGYSPRLRGDLVVNNLVGHAVATGRVLLKSTGSSWRPVVHVRDIAMAFAEVVEAPADRVDRQIFNVGSTAANYRVRRLAEMVAEIIPAAALVVAGDASADARSYRVNCDRLAECLPGATPQIGVVDGVVELFDHLERVGLDPRTLEGPRYQRLAHVRHRQDAGRLDEELRPRSTP